MLRMGLLQLEGNDRPSMSLASFHISHHMVMLRSATLAVTRQIVFLKYLFVFKTFEDTQETVMANLITINTSSYTQEVVESSAPVLVKFWAPWCAPCKMLDPIVESISDEKGDALKVVTLNVDEAPDLAAQHGVRSLPTIALFKKGEKVEVLTGVQPKENIDALIARHA